MKAFCGFCGWMLFETYRISNFRGFSWICQFLNFTKNCDKECQGAEGVTQYNDVTPSITFLSLLLLYSYQPQLFAQKTAIYNLICQNFYYYVKNFLVGDKGGGDGQINDQTATRGERVQKWQILW